MKIYIFTRRTNETKVKKVAASVYLAKELEIAVGGLIISGKNYKKKVILTRRTKEDIGGQRRQRWRLPLILPGNLKSQLDVRVSLKKSTEQIGARS